jgi:hypothetical protein
LFLQVLAKSICSLQPSCCTTGLQVLSSVLSGGADTGACTCHAWCSVTAICCHLRRLHVFLLLFHVVCVLLQSSGDRLLVDCTQQGCIDRAKAVCVSPLLPPRRYWYDAWLAFNRSLKGISSCFFIASLLRVGFEQELRLTSGPACMAISQTQIFTAI